MNVFIDLGCYNGDSVEEFKNWRKLAFPDKSDWVIHAFDPNPLFEENWKKLSNKSTHFYRKAAWIENGTMEFAVDSSKTPLGSTLMPGKQKIWDNSEKIIVETFDFPEWVKQFDNDYLVVKIDCEGAEFPILERMIVNGSIKMLDVLLVEFHHNKVVEYTTTDKIDLINRIKDVGVNINEWH